MLRINVLTNELPEGDDGVHELQRMLQEVITQLGYGARRGRLHLRDGGRAVGHWYLNTPLGGR
jgi:hypothetical protein